MLYGTLSNTLLGNLLVSKAASKGVHAGDGVMWAGKGIIGAKEDF